MRTRCITISACLRRECSECGTKKFQLSGKEKADTMVNWKRYEYVSVPDKNGEERKKIALVTKETPVTELFSYFLHLLKDYPYHSFMAKWQKEQFDNLVNNLPPDNIICVHGFSENYTCRSQDEIQSQYFDPNKVSIHVSILYCHVSLPVDEKESTEEKPELIKEHIFVLSDDNTQDYHFVHHSQKLIFDYITKELNLQIKKVHEFTDGCAGQYKSRHTFGDLSCSLADFGFQVDRHFFKTSHAKGEQDAAGANIKQRATLAVLRRETSITSAKDLYEYLSRTLRNPTSQSENVTLKKRVFSMFLWMARERYPGEGKALHSRSSRASERSIASRQHLSSARYTQDYVAVHALSAWMETMRDAKTVQWWMDGRKSD